MHKKFRKWLKEHDASYQEGIFDSFRRGPSLTQAVNAGYDILVKLAHTMQGPHVTHDPSLSHQRILDDLKDVIEPIFKNRQGDVPWGALASCTYLVMGLKFPNTVEPPTQPLNGPWDLTDLPPNIVGKYFVDPKNAPYITGQAQVNRIHNPVHVLLKLQSKLNLAEPSNYSELAYYSVLWTKKYFPLVMRQNVIDYHKAKGVDAAMSHSPGFSGSNAPPPQKTPKELAQDWITANEYTGPTGLNLHSLLAKVTNRGGKQTTAMRAATEIHNHIKMAAAPNDVKKEIVAILNDRIAKTSNHHGIHIPPI